MWFHLIPAPHEFMVSQGFHVLGQNRQHSQDNKLLIPQRQSCYFKATRNLVEVIRAELGGFI